MDPRDGEAILDGETNDFRSSYHPEDDRSQPHTGDGASPGLISFLFFFLFLFVSLESERKVKESLEIFNTHHLITCKNVN